MESKAHSHYLGRDLRPDRQEGVRGQKGEEAPPAQLKPAGKAKKGKDFVPQKWFLSENNDDGTCGKKFERQKVLETTVRARKCGQQ